MEEEASILTEEQRRLQEEAIKALDDAGVITTEVAKRKPFKDSKEELEFKATVALGELEK